MARRDLLRHTMTVAATVAAILAENVRRVDTIARTGADEFVLVAPGSAGVTVARRIMDGIARLEIRDHASGG